MSSQWGNLGDCVSRRLDKSETDANAALGHLRDRLARGGLPDGSWVSALGYDIRINDGPNLCVLFKDVFCRKIYHFDAARDDPVILDCGSNIGMSILYFRYVWPQARITAFEPDPEVLPYLRDNLVRNGLTDVRLIEAALGAGASDQTFYADGKYSSTLVKAAAEKAACTTCTVSTTRLRDHLTESIDFLKMNIEGAEWDVLADSEDRLARVRAMAIEYHHLPGLPRTLHRILELLDRTGFDYLIHDYDAETNPRSQPPFHLGADSRYYLLIYAQRRDA